MLPALLKMATKKSCRGAVLPESEELGVVLWQAGARAWRTAYVIIPSLRVEGGGNDAKVALASVFAGHMGHQVPAAL